MRSLTITLTADETAQSIASLMGASSIPVYTGTPTKTKNLVFFHIYPETTNDIDPANGAARIGFDTFVSRVVATEHGVPLTPIGSAYQFPAAGGGAAIYDLNTTYIAGKIGDKFQLQLGTV